MLISESLIFIHYPRAGGASIQEYLQRAVPGRYYPFADQTLNDGKKAWVMHQGIGVGFQYAAHLGLDPMKIPALVCIRNPYSVALSGFTYLTQRWKHKIDDLEDNFTDYLVNLGAKTPAEKKSHWANARYGQYSDFIALGDRVPPNLTIARTENLQADVEGFVRQVLGVQTTVAFPHNNASQHGHFSGYYTAREEQMVYDMWKNAFDSGLYQRYEGLNRDAL